MPPSDALTPPVLSPSRQLMRDLRSDPAILQLQQRGMQIDCSAARWSQESPDGVFQHRLTLDCIEVNKPLRGQGMGRDMMAIITSLADKHGVILDLEVGGDPDDPGIDLVQWYSSMGFRWEDGFMARQPQPLPGIEADAYHVTTSEALKSIRREGLLPQVGERSQSAGDQEAKIYLFRSRRDTENALMNWMGECFGDGDEIVIVKVSTAGLALQHEPGQFELTTTDPISASAIVGVYDESFEPLRWKVKLPAP